MRREKVGRRMRRETVGRRMRRETVGRRMRREGGASAIWIGRVSELGWVRRRRSQGRIQSWT
jgi:hypothetical protein